MKDRLFANPLSNIAPFEFNQQVADVFPDMIYRSVPGYRSIIAQLGVIANHYAQPDSHYYDLGCSLGAATLSMMQQIKQPNCSFFAVDQSQAMLNKCQQQVNNLELPHTLHLRCEDIQDTPIEKAAVIVLNFTLQFIAPEKRLSLLQKIYHGLKPNGVLILSEKICFEDSYTQTTLTELHHDFKRAQGYSDLEISQKRSALENVLIPETLAQHS